MESHSGNRVAFLLDSFNHGGSRRERRSEILFQKSELSKSANFHLLNWFELE